MGAGDEPAGDAAAQRADDAGPAREEQHGEDGDGGTEVLMRIDVRLVFDEGALERRRARDAPAPDEGPEGAADAPGADGADARAEAPDGGEEEGDAKLSFFASVPGHGDLASSAQPRVPAELDAADGSLTLSAEGTVRADADYLRSLSSPASPPPGGDRNGG